MASVQARTQAAETSRWLAGEISQALVGKLRPDGFTSDGAHQSAEERKEAVSELHENELLIEREFNAPVPLVFRLWERRDHMLRWWGPEKFTAIELDWELTPDRPWRGAMTSKQYGLSKFGGVIREVEKNKRIVFTFQWDEDPGRYCNTLVTVTFAEKDGKYCPDIPSGAIPQRRNPRQPCRRVEFALQQATDLRREHRHRR